MKSKNKLVIIEGPQGVGKTTITDYLRNTLPHTNLLRLSGSSDSSKKGLRKTVRYYNSILRFMKSMENTGLNLLFDRTFFTEEIYCRLGYKNYNFSRYFKKYLKKLSQLNFEIYYITLYLSNTENYKQRLNREGKAKVSYAKFDIKNSEEQQAMYGKLYQEVNSDYWDKIICRYIPTDSLTKEELFKQILNIIKYER